MSILMLLLFSLSAFAVDVGNWYLTGQKLQKAADAAALAGVPRLPGDSDGAFSVARDTTAANGFTDGGNAMVTTEVDGQPTRLRVTVASTVHNAFGSLLGISDTTIVRTSVADFAGPVPMGSPCNTFGNDPDPGVYRGGTCAGVSGQFWANINSYATDKEQGDRFASSTCSPLSRLGLPTDGCSGGTNSEFAADGYYYTVTVPEGLPDLTIQVFDPAWVNTGNRCLDVEAFGTSPSPRAARNPYMNDAAVRYGWGTGASGAYCTGDSLSGLSANSATPMTTSFEVRSPSPSPWDVNSAPVINQSGCAPITYPGYDGPLYPKLNQTSPQYDDTPVIAPHFRVWSELCTLTNPAPGDYLVRVSVPPDDATGTNHFSLRAYSSAPANTDKISISGREAMSLYSNAPRSGVTEFYLARIPSGSAGKELAVELFDAGDSDTPGTIRVVAPPGSGVNFTNCTATGPASGVLPNCSFAVNSLTHNGRVQEVLVPIPSDYRCNDRNLTQCWVRLHYTYGVSAAPTDVTTWKVSLLGDPVRLVE